MAFPVTVVDNFYKNPDKIREYALSLEYTQSPTGHLAGKTSEFLHVVDKKFAEYCNARFLNLYFDYELTPEIGWNIYTFFNIIEPYGDKNSPLNKSWVHMDQDALLAGVVYLSPNAYLDSGTSVYRAVQEITYEDTLNEERRQFHLTGTEYNGYVDSLNSHNSKFEETISVKNVYNRLLTYDASTWHCANNYWNNNEPRLTQLFFVYRLDVCNSKPPLIRLNDMDDYSEFLK